MSLHAPAQYNAVRALSFPVTSGHRGQRLWGAAPPDAALRRPLHFDLLTRQPPNIEMETTMKTIILNHYYPHLTERVMLEVSDEIAVTLSIGGRLCDSYKRRKREHDECSLDSTPGFEADVTPEQVMEDRENRAALYAAIDQLPPVQAQRVYAHYILGISRADLARAEGVGISRISGSIDRGLLNLKNILENSI